MTDLYALPTRACPENSPETLGTDKHSIGWAKGKISDGRPYWAECWAQDGITMLTIYLSSDGLKLGDDHSLQDDLPESIDLPEKVIVGDVKVAKDFLEKERLIRFRDNCFVTPCRFSDDNGDFWSINIIVGNDDEVYCDSQFSIFPYGGVSTAD